MPRRAAAVRREVQPDAVYNNRLVTQLINKILLDGKKSTAEGIVYGAFELVQAKTGFREEARGPVQDGRVQPCVLALPLLGRDLTWLKLMI